MYKGYNFTSESLPIHNMWSLTLVTIFLWSPTILPWTQFPISVCLISLNPEDDVWQISLPCLECELFDLLPMEEFSSEDLLAISFGTKWLKPSELEDFSLTSVSFLSQFECVRLTSWHSLLSILCVYLDDWARGTKFPEIFSGSTLVSGISPSSFPYNYYQQS